MTSSNAECWVSPNIRSYVATCYFPDQFLASLVWQTLFSCMQGHLYCFQYKPRTRAVESDDMRWAKLGAYHTILVHSCHINTLFKALHLVIDTSTNTQLIWSCDNYSWRCVIWNYEIYSYLHRRISLFTKNFTSKVWS